MRLVAALFPLVLISLTVPSFAKAAGCEAFARSVIAVAMSGQADARLVAVAQVDVVNEASDAIEKVERLTFATGGGEIIVDALPSYYSKGKCELKSLSIVRE